MTMYDVAIIGGGINGAGVANLAAHLGLNVILFEKGDFASGSSSKSTKLIHGGIRYLEQFNFHLVYEALHERKNLLKIAPHLAHPLTFLLPCYKGDKRKPWMLRLGLHLYDFLAGRKNLKKHRWLNADEALQRAPGLKKEGLLGCGLYSDAQTNDARLVIENILSAQNAGAVCFNYAEVNEIEKADKGYRVKYTKSKWNEKGEIFAKWIINATGPWANVELFKNASPHEQIVRPSRGSHLVVPEILKEDAVLIPTPDGRVIFIIPWQGYNLVGTTDIDDSRSPDEVKATEEEISYLLKEASRIFPTHSWTKDQVIATFSGLRPLAYTKNGSSSSVSREDKIEVHDNVITIVGGKLSTYRKMAENTLKLVTDKKTLITRLPGTPQEPWDEFIQTAPTAWEKEYQVPQDVAYYLASLYGARGKEVLDLTLSDPTLKERLHPNYPEILAQVAFSVLHEDAIHLDDVLLRRMEVGYSAYRHDVSEAASKIMAKLLKWSEDTRLAEIAHYEKSL